MSQLAKDMISVYRAGIEPWKIHHDEAMRDWDDFENVITSAARLLGTLIDFYNLHNRLVAAGRFPFDPEFEEGTLKGIRAVLEDAPLILKTAREYESKGCVVEGLEAFRLHLSSAKAIADQYANEGCDSDMSQAQDVSPDYDELRDMMKFRPKSTNWCDDDDI